MTRLHSQSIILNAVPGGHGILIVKPLLVYCSYQDKFGRGLLSQPGYDTERIITNTTNTLTVKPILVYCAYQTRLGRGLPSQPGHDNKIVILLITSFVRYVKGWLRLLHTYGRGK